VYEALLRGNLSYRFPHTWDVHSSADSIEIVPATRPNGLIGWFVALAVIAFIGGNLWLLFSEPFSRKELAYLGVAGVSLSQLFFAAVVNHAYLKERQLGPIFLMSPASRKVTLPRMAESFPFERIVRWEIVHGAWISPKNGTACTSGNICELQMIVRVEVDKEEGIPVIGAMSKTDRKFRMVADAVSSMMGLPLIETKISRPVNWLRKKLMNPFRSKETE